MDYSSQIHAIYSKLPPIVTYRQKLYVVYQQKKTVENTLSSKMIREFYRVEMRLSCEDKFSYIC